MSKDNLIVAQCCFKGAIDLAVANKITVDEINEVTKQFTENIINNWGGGITAVVPAKPTFNPNANWGKAKANTPAKIQNPNADASEKQIGYIKSLIAELPVSEQSVYTDLLKGKVNKGTASAMIEKLKGIIDDNAPKPKLDTTPDEAPF